MQERAEKTKKKILEAAIKLFSAGGFSGTIIEDIAVSAGVNKQRIYAYYGSKMNLFEAVIAEVFRSTNYYDKKLLSLDESDIPAMTGILLLHYMDTYRRRPEFWRLIAWANLEFGNTLKSIKGIKSESLEHLRKLYLRGIEKKVFKNTSMSFETYVYVIWAVTFFHNSNKRTLQQSLGPELFNCKTQNTLFFNEIAGLF
jgi:AcrR family transcriptional regulator